MSKLSAIASARINVSMTQLRKSVAVMAAQLGIDLAPATVGTVVKSIGGTDENLETELTALSRDIADMGVAVEEFVAAGVAKQAAADADVPEELFKMVEDLKNSIPTPERVKELVEGAVGDVLGQALAE